MNDVDILRELKKISKILLLTNAAVVEEELAKIASTDDRKRMWVLIDGSRMPKDIANEARVTQRAISYFLNAAEAAGLIEYKHGEPPRRVLDYVPASWIELLTPTQTAETVDNQSEKPQAPLDTSYATRRSVKEGGS